MNSSRCMNLPNRPRFVCVYSMVAAWVLGACSTGPDEGGPIDLDDSEVVMAAFDGTALTWRVWRADAGGGSPRQVDLPTGDADFPETRWVAPEWSPDGENMLFRATSTGTDDWYYLLFDRQGRNRRVVTPVGGFADRAVWSPDGTRILYQAGFVGELVESRIATVADGQFTLLKLVDGVVVDGDPIFFDQRTEDVCFGPAGTTCGLYDAAFSDDDELYVVGAVGKNWRDPSLTGEDLELFAVDLDTGRPTRRITDNDLDETRFQLSPDARYAIVSRLSMNVFVLWALDLETGELIRIAEPTSGFRGNALRWSNDSRRIVWAHDPDVAWFDVRDPLIDHPIAELAGVSEADLYVRH